MALTQVSRGLLSTSIVDNGNATAITIDSSENVGIGTSSPATLLELSANNDGATANNTLRFTDTDTGTEANQQIGKIEFKSNDSSGDGALVRSYILSASEDTTPSSYISFGTNPGGAGNTTDERMRIDASGNVLVGKTSTGDYVTGIEMQPAGALLSYRTSGVASIFGRTDDGEITRFTRNGSVLGGIGARTSSQLYIALGSTGLTGSSTGGGALIPTSGGTSYTDAAVDLGFSSGRFKDLYLSSKVRLQYPGNSYYARVEVDSSTNLIFGAGANGAEGMRLSSGNLLVGRTSEGTTGAGHSIRGDSSAIFSRTSGEAISANSDADGAVIKIRKSGTTVGSIGAFTSGTSAVFFGSLDTALIANSGNDSIHPWNASTNSNRDNAIDFGNASNRWDDIYATNGTIQTSDRNEKQDIEALSDAEQRVAVAAKGLLRKFRWISSVEAKGDNARIHFGIIAQDLQAAFTAEGLDAGRYAMFTSNTWTDEDTGEERTRLGVRYSELLAFIISAI